MRTLSLLVLALASMAAIATNPMAAGLDIVSHDLNVQVVPGDTVAHVTARLQMRGVEGKSKVLLLLSTRSVIDEGWVVRGADSLTANFAVIGTDSLEIELPAGLRSYDSLALGVEYEFPLPPGSGARIYLDRGYRWYPMLLDDVSFCHLRVHASEEYVVFGPGDRIDTVADASGWREWQSSIPVFKIPLVLVRDDQYTEADTTIGSVTIRLVTCDSTHADVHSILDRAATNLTFLEGTFGDYPHRDLTLVEMPDFPGANIATGLVLIGTEAIKQMGLGEFEQLDLCLAMQWFGAGVFGHFMDKGFWFTSLSLPHSVRTLIDAERSGTEHARTATRTRFEKYREIAGTAGDVSLADIELPNTQEKGIVLYAKGPYLLDQARSRLGEDGWIRFLKRLYRDHIGRVVTLDAFFATLATEDPGDRTTSWLKKQVWSTGLPTD